MNRMVRLDSTTMFAAGETAYRYTLGTVGINETAPAPEDAHILKVYPNPASTDLSIELGILTNTNAVLTFLTADGKLLQTLCHQGLLKGHYNWVIDLKPYRSGEYIIHLRTNRQNFGKKVVVNKTD